MISFKFLTTIFMLALVGITPATEVTQTSFKDGLNLWQVEVKKIRGLDTLIMEEKSSKKTLRYQSDSIAHSFVRMSSLTFSKSSPLYLVTIWKKGAHGESIKVLDTSADNAKDLVAYSYNSAWPLEYEYKKEDGELVIYGKGAMKDDGTPEEEIRSFKP